jgi:WD40 repeat protein
VPTLGQVDLQRWPHVLALPLAEYARATNPYLKLHRLTDAAETLTRFCTVVALGDLLDRNPQQGFPETVRNELQGKLDRPTFGAWRELLKVAVEALPPVGGRRHGVLAELSGFVRERLLPLLGSGGTRPEEGIIALRNVLAHSGRLTEADEGRFLEQHLPRFEQLLEGATFFAELQVIGSPEPDRAFLLHGVPAAGQSFPPFDPARLPEGTEPPRPERLLLLADDRVLDLFPLHAYADVFHYTDRGREETRAGGKDRATDPRAFFERVPEASPAALLYFRRGAKDYLEYTVFSPHAAHSQEGFAALERFKQLFRLEEWRRQAEARAARSEFDFSPWYGELLELFVGRDEQVRQVNEWIKQTANGLCWLHGHPSVGKSAFVAKLARDFFTDERKVCKVVHFFRATDPRCNRMKFLGNALTQLGAVFGRAEPLEADPGKRADQFNRLLTAISQAEAARPELQQRRILFLLDGLDEVCQHESDFLELIFRHCLPGVVWLCAGREELGLGQHFRQAGAHLPFGTDGLPGLKEADVREVLDHECGRQIYELIARDRPDTPPGGNANPFLEELVRRSGGLPLYLRLLVQDVREGRLSFKEGEERKLPHGLSGYYERILERLQVSDVSAVLTPVICLLALAQAPLTFDTIKSLLVEHRLLRRPGGADLLRRALDFGHVMLKRAVVTEPSRAGEAAELATDTGYTLYHESFRDHLLKSDTVRESVGVASDDFCRFVVHWQDWRDELFSYRYALRFGPAHLAEANRWPQTANVLTDLRFIEAKCLAGMVYDLQADYLKALATLPEAREEQEKEAAREQGVAHYTRELISYARAWNEARDRHAADPVRHPLPTDSAIPLPAVVASVYPHRGDGTQGNSDRVISTPPRLDRLRSFSAFVTSESHNLVRFVQVPGFCLQQAYNSQASGVVGQAAEQILSAEPLEAVVMLRHTPNRLTPEPHPVLLRTLQGHTSRILDVAMSADGRWGASVSFDGSLRIWDTQNGQCRHVLPADASFESAVALSADGSRVIASDGRGLLRVWATESGEVRALLPGHESNINAVDMSADGRWAVTSGKEDSTVRVWDLDARSCRHVLKGHTRWIQAVSISANGRTAVSAGHDGTIRVWDLVTGQCLDVLESRDLLFNDLETGIQALCMSIDGKAVLSGSGEIRLWDLRTREITGIFRGHTDNIVSLALSADCRCAVSVAKGDLSLLVWDLQTGRCGEIPDAHSKWIRAVAISADGRRALSGGEDNLVKVWDLEKGQLRQMADSDKDVSPFARVLAASHPAAHLVKGETRGSPAKHWMWVRGVAWGQGGRVAFSGGEDGCIRTWDPDTAQCRGGFRAAGKEICTLAVSGNGRRLAAAGWEKGIAVYELEETGMIMCALLQGHSDVVYGVALSEDGRVAISGSWDQHVAVWSVDEGRWRHAKQDHQCGVTAVAINRSGTRGLSGDERGTVRFWDLETGECIGSVAGASSKIAVLAADASWQWGVSGGYDGRICIWDLTNGRLQAVLEGHTQPVRAAAISPDGGWLASGSEDQAVRLWDLHSGRCRGISAHPHAISCLAAHGQRLVVGDGGGHVYFIDIRRPSTSAGTACAARPS